MHLAVSSRMKLYLNDQENKERMGEMGSEAGERNTHARTQALTPLFVPFNCRGRNAENTSQVRRILQPARVL